MLLIPTAYSPVCSNLKPENAQGEYYLTDVVRIFSFDAGEHSFRWFSHQFLQTTTRAQATPKDLQEAETWSTTIYKTFLAYITHLCIHLRLIYRQQYLHYSEQDLPNC